MDDERNIRTTLRMCLEGLGCEVREAATPDAALAALAQSPADLAFVDLRLGTSSGLDLLPRLLAESPPLDVVLITAYATFDTAVEDVVAAALQAHAQVIVTSNLKHFHAKDLPPNVEAQHPDEFLVNLLDLDPSGIRMLLKQQAAALRRPPMEVSQLLNGLEKTVPEFARLMRASWHGWE